MSDYENENKWLTLVNLKLKILGQPLESTRAN